MAGKKKEAEGTFNISQAELLKLIDEGVKKALPKALKLAQAEMLSISHEVTQDQHDMLSIVAPDKFARHEYSIVELTEEEL